MMGLKYSVQQLAALIAWRQSWTGPTFADLAQGTSFTWFLEPGTGGSSSWLKPLTSPYGPRASALPTAASACREVQKYLGSGLPA